MSPAFDRRRTVERLGAEEFDVLVVGGGVTGCGVALDAAARGLRTALVTDGDFASGTSSKSSKLVHGGLRYLSQREYRLVYEALAERQRLLDNAPHLVRPLPFLIPLFGRDGVASRSVAKAYSVALWTYDVTGGLRIGRRHRRLPAAAARNHFPDLRPDRLTASFLYWDAQADDARLTLALARTAALGHGAAVANHLAVTALIGGDDGPLRGARLADGTDVRAEVVVNAGGVWSEDIGRLGPGTEPTAIRPAKGVHVTVPAHRLPCDYAAVLPTGDRRSVFVVPWVEPGFTYIGTTDTDYRGSLDDPRCTAADVTYLLDAVNAWTTADLRPGDVTGTWAGLRPLVSGAADERTADLSRRHRVTVSPNQLVTVTGGKLTTYRQMATETVDRVVTLLGRRLAYSPTRRLALWGAEGTAELREPGMAGRLGVSEPVLDHLTGRYGGEARALIAMIAADAALGAPLVAGLPYVRAEAVFAARYEMATTLDDVLCRRTRCWILDREATVAAAPAVARLLADELGWTATETDDQVAALVREARAERAALATDRPVSAAGVG